MQNWNEILKAKGVEVPEDKVAEIDKEIAAQYKTVVEVERKLAKRTKPPVFHFHPCKTQGRKRIKGYHQISTQGLDKDQNSGILEDKIASGEITLKLNPLKQGPHMLGDPLYDPNNNKSYFTIPYEELQALVYALHGKGKVTVFSSGQIKEAVLVGRNIGFCVDKDTGAIIGPANAMTIHYSKDRTHVVPLWKEEKR